MLELNSAEHALLGSSGELNCVCGYIPSILCSNARAPVAQLVRTSCEHSEDTGLSLGWIAMFFILVRF